MVRFVDMSRAQARTFLDGFRGELTPRLAALRSEAAASGGPSPRELDLTPASLGPLWAWAAPRLSWREGYEPPPPGQPGGRVALTDLEPPEQLPSWFDPIVPGWARWAPASLWLIDGLARYLGETLVVHVPGARWAAGHARARGYVYENHPVVTGLAVDDSEPMGSVAIIAARVLLPTPGPATLHDLYTAWT